MISVSQKEHFAALNPRNNLFIIAFYNNVFTTQSMRRPQSSSSIWFCLFYEDGPQLLKPISTTIFDLYRRFNAAVLRRCCFGSVILLRLGLRLGLA
ncbi:hypothetical protein NPIL_76331 [Nephila pilipes]|uniref:Uncharacterized protein n=1 Tax=Nephila pilipes TaxID=299642 RepID=A0A8X6NZG4_NEPPI|nr:hypothetical protein NPIL_76331 [Nephila pilipes]